MQVYGASCMRPIGAGARGLHLHELRPADLHLQLVLDIYATARP